jgi:hypothetical protein
MAEIINNRTDPHLAYSRLRGPQLIRRGSWVATGNGRWGRCKCGGATLYGVCQQCSDWDHDIPRDYIDSAQYHVTGGRKLAHGLQAQK